MQQLDHQRDSKLSACVDDLVFEAIVEPEAPTGNELSPTRATANGSPASSQAEVEEQPAVGGPHM